MASAIAAAVAWVGVTARLRRMWEELNSEHFDNKLVQVPIRVTRSRNTYGYFNGPANGQASIRISTVLAASDKLLRDTMLHEMIHQVLYEQKHPEWDGHGADFQKHHVRVFGHHYVEL